MKVTNEKTENHQAFLEIAMEASETEESLDNAYRRLVKRVNVPGFRKGKAPRAVLERHVGQEALVNEMLDEVLPRAYEKAIEEQGLEAIARPQLEIVQKEPVVFKAIVPLKPVVKLGDYHQVSLSPEPVEVTDETVDAVIEQLRHQNATWVPVERAVELGDLVTIDVESTCDGEPIINQKGAQYQVIGESVAPAPGFAEQLVGMAKNEEKEFQITLPDDYSRSELAGKEVSFKVMVSEVKQENLPDVTDEFAGQVETNLKSVEELRDRIHADMEKRMQESARREFEDRVIQAVVELSEVEFPPVLVESEIHRMLDNQASRLQMQGLTMEMYLKTVDKTEEELHEEARPVAEQRVTRGLVLGRLAEEEKIEVTDADVDAEVDRMLESASEGQRETLKQVFSTEENQESIRDTLLSRKTIERIVEIAQGSEDKTSQKEDEE